MPVFFVYMDILILILATWRISSLLVYEDGPLDVFERLRERVGIHYNEYSEREASNELGRLLLCLWCLSVWIGSAWVIAYAALDDLAVWLALPFALSAGAMMLDALVGEEVLR